jgi:hypothetical protein
VSVPSPAQAPSGVARTPVRDRRGPARLGALVALAAVSVLVFIALSVMFAPPDVINSEGTGVPYNFKSERGTITLLSSGMFFIAACLAASWSRSGCRAAGTARCGSPSP